tara:strand:+ start:170 stop:577 length:408 start_codon:yes stop_codon:yes gene_type:complete
MMKNLDLYLTSQKGTYFATSCMGYCTGRNPFEAMGRLARIYGLGFDSKDTKTGSDAYLEQTRKTNLWWIPNVDLWDHVDNYRPCDEDGKTCAIPLYAGEDEHNERVTSAHLSKSWDSFTETQKELNEYYTSRSKR